MIATAPAPQRIDIKPQPGPQTRFLQSTADVTIYGGAAGSGKSFGTLLFPLRHAVAKPVDGFQAVIFRRTYKRITQAGGLEDESKKIYPLLGATYNNTDMEWRFERDGCESTIQFAHLQHESDKEGWKGAQISLIAFEELTEFPESSFFYLQSRNRSTCGVKPQTIATCNADATSWVKSFLAPWVDDQWPDDDRARSGETRYYIRDGNAIRWLKRGEMHEDATSVRFIFANVYDNPILLAKDPNYVKRLKALPLIDRLRLLNGDWNVRPTGGTLFRTAWFPIVDAIPAGVKRLVRGWDLASTEEKNDEKRGGPDWTAGVKVARLSNGQFIVLDARRMRETPKKVDIAVCNTASQDGISTSIFLEQEPGSSGVRTISDFATQLSGYDFHGVRSTGSKVERARGASSQAENGNILLLRGPWNDDFLAELESFPDERMHDDWVDAFTLAMGQLFGVNADSLIDDIEARLKAKEVVREQIAETYW